MCKSNSYFLCFTIYISVDCKYKVRVRPLVTGDGLLHYLCFPYYSCDYLFRKKIYKQHVIIKNIKKKMCCNCQ